MRGTQASIVNAGGERNGQRGKMLRLQTAAKGTANAARCRVYERRHSRMYAAGDFTGGLPPPSPFAVTGHRRFTFSRQRGVNVRLGRHSPAAIASALQAASTPPI